MSNKYLITGCSGFVGQYLIAHIIENEPDAVITGVDINDYKNEGDLNFYNINLLDSDSTTELISSANPDYLIHLASFSSVAYSWENPIESFKNNTNIFLNILEAVHRKSPKSKILSVGSSEEYGIVDETFLPLSEKYRLNPVSPYAVARVSQEQLSIVYAKAYDLDIVCTRTFNHIGPGQLENFVISSIGKQFAEIIKGTEDTLKIGNTTAVRDFLDVRDVVKAYYLLLKKGKSGEVFNICSGKGHTIDNIINMYKEMTGQNPVIENLNTLMRPIDNKIVIGSNEKIVSEIGWSPEIDIYKSLTDILNYWSDRI